jgi:hypothetical protein
MNRLEALRAVAQAGKDLKQPICQGPRVTGQPVTVHFEEV